MLRLIKPSSPSLATLTLLALLLSFWPPLTAPLMGVPVEAKRPLEDKTVGSLLRMLREDSRWDKINAASEMHWRDVDLVIGALIAALKDDDPKVRAHVAWVLGSVPDNRAVEPLLALLKDTNKEVRGRAAGALAVIGDARALDPLVTLLKEDRSSFVRTCTATHLDRIDDPRAVVALVNALKDRNRNVRVVAVQALGRTEDVRAIEPLIDVLDDRSKLVRYHAKLCLEGITGQDLGKSSKNWRQWWKENKEGFLKSKQSPNDSGQGPAPEAKPDGKVQKSPIAHATMPIFQVAFPALSRTVTGP